MNHQGSFSGFHVGVSLEMSPVWEKKQRIHTNCCSAPSNFMCIVCFCGRRMIMDAQYCKVGISRPQGTCTCTCIQTRPIK